jgi:membrane-associated protease RseP (regulator of RpoE activity)
VDPYLGYEIAGLVVLVYAAVVYVLYKTGRIGPDRSVTFFGPALMIKTTRGRSALDRWGRFRRFWSVAGDIGIALSIVAMGTMVVLLLFGAVVSLRLSPSQAPSPQEALGLPGINPIIPLGYGIVAIVIGVVVHELWHGIIARSQKIGVKSLGILWCVIPIGAFVEQDDTEMLAAPRRHRDRVAAAGVLANFVLTIIFFVALSVVVAGSVAPNANGVGVALVQSNSPAANVSLAPGDIITAINGTNTTSASAFQSALSDTSPGQVVNVTYYSAATGRTVTVAVTLAQSPSVKTRGFLGVAVDALTPPELKQTLVWPLGSQYGPLTGAVDWIVLPLATLEPVSGSTTDYFHLTGPFAHTDPNTFWIGANLLYWLAWMNLLLGISNALPLFPLDGGLLFRDYAATVASRVKRGWSEARLDAFAGRAVAASSLLVLFLLVWQFVAPRLL